MTIIFLRTRYSYDSYTDYWRIVEASGFPTMYLDETDLREPGTLYIVSPLNGEWRPHIDHRFPKGRQLMEGGATLALWNLERPSGAGGISDYRAGNKALLDAHYFDTILVSDRALARVAGAHFVPFGWHPAAGSPGREKAYDFIPLMCYSNHRGPFFERPDRLRPHYFDMTIAPNAWGEDRHRLLRASRFLLNIHQDNQPWLEPLRFALACAYDLPIVSEAISDPFPYTAGVDYIPIDQTLGTPLSMRRALDFYQGHMAVLRQSPMRDSATGNFRRLLEAHL